jgi:hypothetical protein
MDVLVAREGCVHALVFLHLIEYVDALNLPALDGYYVSPQRMHTVRATQAEGSKQR